jgi:hypothetical protein
MSPKMKSIRKSHRGSLAIKAGQMGFTVPEFVITMALVSIVSGGMLACLLFGGKMVALTSNKLEYSSDIRDFESTFIHAIRTAADIDVGQGTTTTFTPLTNNAALRGNAIQIYPEDNTNMFIRLFVDSSDRCLKLTDSFSGEVSTLTDAITNANVFWFEDFSGNVLTNDQHAYVVSVLLQFNIPNAPNSSSLSDYRQFSTKVTRRTPLGYQK